MVLLTVLGKLYKELHSAIQNSPELSACFPTLANAHMNLIAAATLTTAGPMTSPGPGATVLGPVPNATLQLPAQGGADATAGRSNPIKPLIKKALQMTGSAYKMTSISLNSRP